MNSNGVLKTIILISFPYLSNCHNPFNRLQEFKFEEYTPNLIIFSLIIFGIIYLFLTSKFALSSPHIGRNNERTTFGLNNLPQHELRRLMEYEPNEYSMRNSQFQDAGELEMMGRNNNLV